MSRLRCRVCQNEWLGNVQPQCPHCLGQSWEYDPGFIRDKHDPTHLATSYPEPRTVLSHDFVNRLDDFTQYAAASGTWYWDWGYRNYFHFTPEPLGTMPGSGVGPGKVHPERAYDGLGIVDAAASPHAIAVEQSTVRSKINEGVYVRLDFCATQDCFNLAVPGNAMCAAHCEPPLADIVDAG